MRAHDVRDLAICAGCGDLHYGRQMVTVAGKKMHGHCAIEQIGWDAFLALAPAELGALTLGDLGAENTARLMRALDAI